MDTRKKNRVALDGEWDLSRKDELKQLFNGLTANDPATVDLRECSYIDSTALSLLAALSIRLRGTPITLLGPNPGILRILKLMRFDGLFRIEDGEHI